jgi:prephenate dehydratase
MENIIIKCATIPIRIFGGIKSEIKIELLSSNMVTIAQIYHHLQRLYEVRIVINLNDDVSHFHSTNTKGIFASRGKFLHHAVLGEIASEGHKLALRKA